MKHFSQTELQALAKRYRAQLINSLSGFKSANLIATKDNDGQTNLAIFSSVVHLGASPALVGFIMRPDSVERHTLENIRQTGSYTINHVTDKIHKAAHQTSARYPKQVCEFKATGLTPLYERDIWPPFVEESPIRYSVSLRDILPIELNNTMMVIGEITDIFVSESAIQQDGYIDIEGLNTLALSGLDSYHKSERLARLSYAKPDITPIEIPLAGNEPR
ncbi:flavin reductase family protein [Thalassotalea sp. LPB0316]|uniref:flavin reductase family protein n=1 Tax=Thalassotalea sp. LPB0316 TaxID=2769490 RepID=UPI00186844AB|nr:flavin reductase family protein [Thalassotalea sp. LPB0316]QOL25134.1 flavin reductase family protein [Thalassotalea sp. LPB0316]